MSAEAAPRTRVTLEELHDRLREAVAAIESGDQWQAWLHFAGRFHRYSFHNLMLIMAQRADATAVASYRTWQAAERQVQRGERSIKILAPVTRREEVTDDQGRPRLDADGRKTTRVRVVGYRPASVFDIAQTSGPPVPEPVRPALLVGEAPAGIWQSLADEISERGYRLLRAGSERLGTANGLAVPDRREVIIRDDVDQVQAVKSLTHELAHIILHVHDERDDEPCRGIREVEAESVAYLTLSAYGIASDAYSFPYVADWAYPVAAVEHVDLADVVSRTGQRVVNAARTIIDAIQPPSPDENLATQAIAIRATKSAERTADLRDEAKSFAVPTSAHHVLFGIVADSQAFFRSQLARSWVPDYLRERGLVSAMNSHEIGYAPDGWTALTDHLRSLGYSDQHIEAAGMSTRARTGRLIDRLRDRMTLPLRNNNGDLVGFTARVGPQAPTDTPKYLNTPSTVIFHKGQLIYRLPENRGRIRDGYRPLICEGPLDAIAVDLAAQRGGIEMVGLATSGTAFTDDHARRLSDVVGTKTIELVFDGDDAGSNAVERAWAKLTDAGHTAVKVAALPQGSDPASLGVQDASELVRVLQDAGGAAYVLADRRIDAADIGDDVQRQVAYFRELSSWAERLPADERVEFVRHLADRIGIDPVDAAADIAERQPNFLSDQAPDAMASETAALAAFLGGDDVPAVATEMDDRPVERNAHRVEIAG